MHIEKKIPLDDGNSASRELSMHPTSNELKAGSSFLELAISWGHNIGMHGLPNITRSDGTMKKIFWTLLLLAGLSLTVIQIKAIVDKFYSYPITVVRGSEINLPRPFPAVTLCNQSPARQSRVRAVMSGTATSTSSSSSNSSSSDSRASASGSSTIPASASSTNTGNTTDIATSASMAAATTVTPKYEYVTSAMSAPTVKRIKRGVGSSPTSSFSGLTSSMYSSGTTRNLSAMNYKAVPDSVQMNYMFLDFYNSLTDTVKTSIGYQIDDLITDCSMGTSYCSSANFTRFLHPTYGNCYTFNAAATNSTRVSVKQQGPLFGLTLTLFIDQTEYVSTVAQSAGIVVVLHEPTVQPFPEESGIRVSPGRETYIGIKQTYKKLLGSPYADNCAVDYEKANSEINMYSTTSLWALPNVNYTKMECLKTCIQRNTERSCNCSSPKLPPSNHSSTPALPICAYNYNSTSGTLSSAAVCMQGIEESAFSTCRAGCQSQCDEFKYDAALSMSKWPSMGYEDDAMKQVMMYNPGVRETMKSMTSDLKSEFVAQNMVKMIVFFDDPETHTEVSVEAYVLTDLLSDMGGQVGLWLGLSVLTLFEILEMMLDFLVLAASKAALRQSKELQQQQQQQLAPGFVQTEASSRKMAEVRAALELANRNASSMGGMWVDEKVHYNI